MGEVFWHIVEWFVAPIVMCILLFAWRDRLNILHMPFADLAGILVVADVALAINADRLPELFHSLGWSNPWGSLRATWMVLCVASLGAAYVLVRVGEEKTRGLAIHHFSLFSQRAGHAGYCRPRAALRTRGWWTFVLYWTQSAAIVAALFALHAWVAGADMLRAALIQRLLAPVVAQLALVTLIATATVFMCAFLLTVFGGLRYSITRIPGTDDLGD